jgi:hypothetical protein
MFWGYVNSKLKTRQPVADLLKDDGSLTTNDKEKAEVLNKFFETVFTNEDTSSIPQPKQQPLKCKISSLSITKKALIKRLTGLKSGKSPGPDGISSRLLKESAQVLASPLKIIFEQSLKAKNTAKGLDCCSYNTNLQKGSNHKAGNYRPVSVTSIVCKIMEGFARDQMLDHLVKNNLISRHQHGFLKGRSTVTQLLEALDHWSQALDDGAQVDVTYLDFQKAFDSVPHCRLLKKIDSYGISGNLQGWIRSFLTGRQQKVIINGSSSDWANIRSGVPQGSVLGPLLFIIFINDMPETVKSKIKLFADDAKLYNIIRTTEDCQQVQEDLTRMQNWSNTWQMKFHPQKCTVLCLEREPLHFQYSLNNIDLKVVEADKASQ